MITLRNLIDRHTETTSTAPYWSTSEKPRAQWETATPVAPALSRPVDPRQRCVNMGVVGRTDNNICGLTMVSRAPLVSDITVHKIGKWVNVHLPTVIINSYP